MYGLRKLLLLLVAQSVKTNLSQVTNSDNLTKEFPYQMGPSCKVNGISGFCMHWKHCYTFMIDRKNNEFPPICSFEGKDPIVCCTSCEFVEDVSKAVMSDGKVLWRTDQTSWDKCIAYSIELPYNCKRYGSCSKTWNGVDKCFMVIENRPHDVYGGRNAEREEFPHMALLGFGPTEDTAQWLCGGTVISDRFILTAAHCTSTSSLGRVAFAALGILKRSDPEHLWQKYRIEEIIPHEEYKAPSKYHDIALLKTAQPITFSSSVLPACLPNLSEEAKDTFAIVAGWGAVRAGAAELADNLQSIVIFKYNTSTCSDQYGIYRHLANGYNHTTQMCYGSEYVIRDTCEGDSGGPLYIGGQALGCQFSVIGVTSFGRPCGHAAQAGVYTRVSYYRKTGSIGTKLNFCYHFHCCLLWNLWFVLLENLS